MGVSAVSCTPLTRMEPVTLTVNRTQDLLVPHMSGRFPVTFALRCSHVIGLQPIERRPAHEHTPFVSLHLPA